MFRYTNTLGTKYACNPRFNFVYICVYKLYIHIITVHRIFLTPAKKVNLSHVGNYCRCFTQHVIRALALRVLKEILNRQPWRFKNYAELTIMKTLEAHKDPHKEVRHPNAQCAHHTLQRFLNILTRHIHNFSAIFIYFIFL